jgi:hypothetical protein
MNKVELTRIADTLLQASQRRDAEVRRRSLSPSPVALATQDSAEVPQSMNPLTLLNDYNQKPIIGKHQPTLAQSSNLMDPKKMLAEIEMQKSLATSDDPKKMLADITRTSPKDHKSSSYDAGDLEAFKSGLAVLLASHHGQDTPVVGNNVSANDAPAINLDEDATLYVFVLRKQLQA